MEEMEEVVVLYHAYDWLVIPLALLFFYGFGHAIARRIKDKEVRKYFIYGLMIKMLATIVYAFVVQYYFLGGDTNRYYVAIIDMKKAVQENIFNLYHIYGKFQLTPENPVAFYFANDKLGDNLIYMLKTSNYTVPRFGVLFSFIFGNSYTAIAMCYSFFAFWGCWKAFTVFARLFPHLKKAMAVAFLFFPSVVYWGSAIMKDSVCLGCLGLFVYSFYWLFFQRRNLWLNSISLLLWGTIMFITKPYLLMALIPGLSLWYLIGINRKIKDRSLRMAAFGVLLVIIAGSVFMLIQFMLNVEFLELDKYKGEKLLQFAATAQEGYKEAGGSTFNIGTLDGTLGSFLTMFPQAVNASLFRPYLWEIRSPAMVISGVESIVILYLFLYALIKLRPGNFFRTIFGSPILVFMFVYSIFLAGLMAITTTNFGSLVRYKIAALPFFVTMLFILLDRIPGIRKHKFIGWLLYTKAQRKQRTQ